MNNKFRVEFLSIHVPFRIFFFTCFAFYRIEYENCNQFVKATIPLQNTGKKWRLRLPTTAQQQLDRICVLIRVNNGKKKKNVKKKTSKVFFQWWNEKKTKKKLKGNENTSIWIINIYWLLSTDCQAEFTFVLLIHFFLRLFCTNASSKTRTCHKFIERECRINFSHNS